MFTVKHAWHAYAPQSASPFTMEQTHVLFFLRCSFGTIHEMRIWNIRVRTDCTPAYTNTEWMKTMKNRPQQTVVYKDIFLGISHCPYRKYCQDARSTKRDTWQLQTGSSHAWNSRYFNSVISIFIFLFFKSDEFIFEASGWIYSMADEGWTYFGADVVPRMFVYLHTSKKIQKYWSGLQALLYSKGAWNSVQFESIPFLNEDTSQYMLFIKQYLDGVTLLEASRQAEISYQKSGVDWASYIRKLFKEDLHRSLPHIRLWQVK